MIFTLLSMWSLLARTSTSTYPPIQKTFSLLYTPPPTGNPWVIKAGRSINRDLSSSVHQHGVHHDDHSLILISILIQTCPSRSQAYTSCILLYGTVIVVCFLSPPLVHLLSSRLTGKLACQTILGWCGAEFKHLKWRSAKCMRKTWNSMAWRQNSNARNGIISGAALLVVRIHSAIKENGTCGTENTETFSHLPAVDLSETLKQRSFSYQGILISFAYRTIWKAFVLERVLRLGVQVRLPI